MLQRTDGAAQQRRRKVRSLGFTGPPLGRWIVCLTYAFGWKSRCFLRGWISATLRAQQVRHQTSIGVPQSGASAILEGVPPGGTK